MRCARAIGFCASRRRRGRLSSAELQRSDVMIAWSAGRAVVVGCLLAVAGGCAKLSASQSSAPPGNAPADVMRVYYATDRSPVQTKAPFFGQERSGLRLGRADAAV